MWDGVLGMCDSVIYLCVNFNIVYTYKTQMWVACVYATPSIMMHTSDAPSNWCVCGRVTHGAYLACAIWDVVTGTMYECNLWQVCHNQLITLWWYVLLTCHELCMCKVLYMYAMQQCITHVQCIQLWYVMCLNTYTTSNTQPWLNDISHSHQLWCWWCVMGACVCAGTQSIMNTMTTNCLSPPHIPNYMHLIVYLVKLWECISLFYWSVPYSWSCTLVCQGITSFGCPWTEQQLHTYMYVYEGVCMHISSIWNLFMDTQSTM